MTPVSIAAYLTLFVGAGFLFLFVNLLVGRFVRPKDPHAEKLEVYECGEPTIGSSFVQFDLRFYVVALLFIIFDVEVAFFFPWATVFGKSTHLMDPNLLPAAQQQARLSPGGADAAQPGEKIYLEKFAELGIAEPTMGKFLADPKPSLAGNAQAVSQLARKVAGASLIDIGVFFAVLVTGFFYVWRRGDLDWVRAVGKQRAEMARTAPVLGEEAPVLSA